jgi:hypothetical protein
MARIFRLKFLKKKKLTTPKDMVTRDDIADALFNARAT